MNDYDVRMFRGCSLLNAAVARVNARVAGMVAENEMRARRGESPAYTEDNFLLVIEEEGIGHNSAINMTVP